MRCFRNENPIASTGRQPCNDFYDYNAKYIDGKSETIIPVDLPSHTVECTGLFGKS